MHARSLLRLTVPLVATGRRPHRQGQLDEYAGEVRALRLGRSDHCARVFRRTDHVVATLPGPIIGVGRTGRLRNNEKVTVTGIVSTASCDGSRALPSDRDL